MNKLIWAPALCLALGAAGAVRAAPPVDADPNRDYPITPEAGPWMICAAYFTGPAAPDLARQTVLQIRNRYHLPAYVFNYADEERKKQQEVLEKQWAPFAEPAAPADGGIVVPIPHHKLQVRVEEQCAVLVGGYPDDEAAHTALLAVKKMPPPELNAPKDVRPYSTFIDHGQERALNPFAQSMVVRNPTVPHDAQPIPPEKDRRLITLNAYEEYSMLQCPQKWTLAVKEYLGASSVQQGGVDNILGATGKGNDKTRDWAGESLNVAGNNAHELARVLRQLKFDAYVLHTRKSSVVSVGGFSGPDDPEVERLRGRIATLQQQMAMMSKDPSHKDPLGLFPTPVPIEVPHP